MSDQPPQPKPKPGSLRDRIAAFEKSTPSNAPPPVAPRPKPGGHVSWKPKQPTPPDSPAAPADESSVNRPQKPGGGMSASDAKESIGKGGSLKERMAALQGKGAFGAPSPPVAPKPAVEKPKWKPPPPVASPPEEEEEIETASDKAKDASPPSVPAKSPVSESNKALGEPDSLEVEAQSHIETEGGGEEEVDPEEEERQRRATLAARMARLGGARVGMGPPVFGGPAYKKPQPKPEPKSEVPSKEDVSEPVKSEVVETGSKEPSLKSPSAPKVEENSDEGTKKDYFDVERKASDVSLLSPDPTPSVSTSPRTPSSMPVPAAPRRAVPPRRKAKSPAPPPRAEEQELSVDPSIEHTKNELDVQILPSADTEELDTAKKILDYTAPLVDDVPPEPLVSEEPAMVVPVEETPIPTAKTEVGESDVVQAIQSASESLVEEPEPTHAEIEEEDEASRRKRVAERLAKSGGVNPFALPPQRRPSLPVTHEESSPPTSTPVSPVSQKRTSIRKVSADSVHNPVPAPPARRSSQISLSSVGPPNKKPSIDSVMSRDIISHDDDINFPVPAGISEEPESIRLVEEADITDEELADEEFSPEGSEEHVEVHEAVDPLEPPQPPVVVPDSPYTKASFSDIEPVHVPPKAASPVNELKLSSSPKNELDHEEPAPPPPPRRSMPPPPRVLSDPIQHEQEERQFPSQSEVPSEPPRRLPPRPVLEDDGEMSDAPLPHPNRLSVPPPPPPQPLVEEGQISDDEPKPIPFSRPVRFVPLPVHSGVEEDVESEEKEEATELERSPEEILPTPPRRPPSPPEQISVQEKPLFVPPPPPPKILPTAPRRGSTEVKKAELSPTLERRSAVSNVQLGRAEILDEEEGDPIDPSFYSPPGRQTSITAVAPDTPELEQAPAEDEEQARRRTIAERMAKLGGLKFGAAPIPMNRPAPSKRRASEESTQKEADAEETDEGKIELNEEEEERARKERIATKLASMGGMRIGMQPYGMFSGQAPSTQPKPVTSSPERETLHAHPAPRHAAPPPPPPHEIDSEHESVATSDEGVKIEAEESEMEEVNYEDANEEQDEIPPPLPTREGRHTSARHVPPGRPPVPTVLPSRKASIQSTTSQRSDDTAFVPPPGKSSSSHQLPPSTSDYVMVEGEEEEELPPPPPPRAGRPVPPRAAPLPPASDIPPSESISSQWEMPSIPSLDFGGNTDLSLSWTDDMALSTSSAQPSPDIPAIHSTQVTTTAAADLVLNSDDLVAVWGRVGVQVCEVATTLFEKSKKVLIGDGTYQGFIDATLREVPNAAPMTGQEYGYLVYMQSGASVQKRASEILPGDIAWMHEAKFKGHKGLQTYSQSVGSEVPLVGVVGEFEAKKFKIRVFQANQHVGQQTVETVSYRLEDLKSGQVKIFRVLEA
ncbi:hypothetical protein HHX47_DHR1001329 [Lentinula edodes]|nr:hypothetical protein HHX47_DHR1001329 [Lentinula edodes]